MLFRINLALGRFGCKVQVLEQVVLCYGECEGYTAATDLMHFYLLRISTRQSRLYIFLKCRAWTIISDLNGLSLIYSH